LRFIDHYKQEFHEQKLTTCSLAEQILLDFSARQSINQSINRSIDRSMNQSSLFFLNMNAWKWTKEAFTGFYSGAPAATLELKG